MVNLAFKSNDLLKETYWYFSMCHLLSKIFFREKEMAHALQLWETLLAHPTFHYMQLVNTSIPKGLLLSLFPPGHPPGIWTFMDWFIQIPAPLPNCRTTIALKCSIQWLHLLVKCSSWRTKCFKKWWEKKKACKLVFDTAVGFSACKHHSMSWKLGK